MGMPSGRVKFFNTDRGYGFIAPDGGGSDVFVHVHDVEAAGMKILVAGQFVDTRSAPRGMAAQRPSIFARLTRSVRIAQFLRQLLANDAYGARPELRAHRQNMLDLPFSTCSRLGRVIDASRGPWSLISSGK